MKHALSSSAVGGTIVCVKGFDEWFRCRGYQFEVGETYEHDGGYVRHGEAGFHAIFGWPLEVFYRYPPNSSRYALVRLGGPFSFCHDTLALSSVCGMHITIDREISAAEVISYAREHVAGIALEPPHHDEMGNRRAVFSTAEATTAVTAADKGAVAAAGDESVAVTTGTFSAAYTSGMSGIAVATGQDSTATTSHFDAIAAVSSSGSAAAAQGSSSVAVATGTRSTAAASEFRGIAATTSENSCSATQGERAIAAATGGNSSAISHGRHSIAVASVVGSKAVAHGKDGVAVIGGPKGTATIRGDHGLAIAVDQFSKAYAQGKDSIAVAAGYKTSAAGAEGCALFLVERGVLSDDIRAIWTGIVGRDGIKPDTLYELINGQPTEVKQRKKQDDKP